MNDVQVEDLNGDLINKYNKHLIYLCDMEICEVVKMKSGYRKKVNKIIKEHVFSEYRFNESRDYFLNQIKYKLNIDEKKEIKLIKVKLICCLGKITINKNSNEY